MTCTLVSHTLKIVYGPVINIRHNNIEIVAEIFTTFSITYLLLNLINNPELFCKLSLQNFYVTKSKLFLLIVQSKLLCKFCFTPHYKLQKNMYSTFIS